VTRNSIGIVHSLEEDGDMGVAFCFRSKPFLCSVADVEKAQPFDVGEKVHVSPSISEPALDGLMKLLRPLEPYQGLIWMAL
jgi:E3 ubiquitin-protein ligase KEG